MLYTRSSTNIISNNEAIDKTVKKKLIKDAGFKSGKKLRVIIHGWSAKGFAFINTRVKDAYLNKSDMNGKKVRNLALSLDFVSIYSHHCELGNIR